MDHAIIDAMRRAQAGERVAFLTASHADAHAAFQSARLAAESLPETDRIHASHGQESIRFTTGGSIIFATQRTPATVRGRILDHAYHRGTPDQRLLENVLPCFATTPGPLITIY